MSKETGGYAFPIPGADFQTFKPSTVDEYKRIQSGMTLRDYLAAKAMQGDWAAQSAGTGEFHNYVDIESLKERAEVYFRMADAMLAARDSNN